MPFALLIAGALIFIVAIRGTHKDLFELLVSDFSGQGNFIYWILSILVVGAFGYIPRMKPISDAFLVLILLVMFLTNKGFFNQFMQQVSGATTDNQVANPSAPDTGIDQGFANNVGTSVFDGISGIVTAPQAFANGVMQGSGYVQQGGSAVVGGVNWATGQISSGIGQIPNLLDRLGNWALGR